MGRKKILFCSDHPLVPSGVGLQARYSIEQLLKMEKYKFFCFGGAIKHPDYTLQQIAPETYGPENWLIQPVDGHGSKELMRKTLVEQKPDAVVLFTDPRFFNWAFEMEDEIRAVCPLVYWHVWDNDPLPDYNLPVYEACDFIMPLSLKTYGILQGLGYPRDRFEYVPHAEPAELFHPLPEEEITKARREHFGPFADREFIVFWNNRNARRKMTGDVVNSFKKLRERVGKEKCVLMMHTSPSDPEGQDLHALVKKFGIEDGFMLSENRITPEQMNMLYNCADVTLQCAGNEGFGLSSLESLFAGTLIAVNMTGGLQFQIGDWWQGLTDFSDQDKLTRIARDRKNTHNWWGEPIYPAARNCVGSQQLPYIYDDRVNDDDVAKALEPIFKMGRRKRRELGLKASAWAMNEFSMERLQRSWDECLTRAIDAWTARKSKGPSVRTAVV